jgi:succinyl-diaminopimelate desuccinylase
MDFGRFLRKRELIDLARQLVQIPTENPPGNEKALVLFLKPLLSKMGFRVETCVSPKERWNIIAERRWTKDGRRFIFNGHLDVVPAGDSSQWRHSPFMAKLEKGRIYGRGASDMKGGIASFLHGVSMIHRSGISPNGALLLHLVSDEESHGHQGMGYLTRKGLVDGDAALVGEPTDLNPVIAEKGALWFRIFTVGKPAHGSRPDLGVNAIEKMLKVIKFLGSSKRSKEHPLLGKATINIGTIQGGTKINVVPGGCMIEVDRRMLPGEKKEAVLRSVIEALNSIQARDPFFRYRLEEIDLAEPSEINPHEEIVKISREAIREVTGKTPKIKGTSGFTDGRYYINQCHIPTLILGPGAARQPHTIDEYVEVDALAQAARIYALIVTNFLDSP